MSVAIPGSRPRSDDGRGERALIQAIGRAADVLALLDQDTPRLSAPLVAERLGLNRTTAYRYLQSLQQAGFLGATAGPGPLLDQLSALVSVRQRLITLAPSIMRQLADSTGLTCVLTFPGRDGAVVTLVEEPQQTTILLTIRVGTVLEAKSAQTRVLLAFQSDPRAIARAHASLTPDQAARERQALADVRRDRVAWADLNRVGLASVAVPVLATYDVQAAMALIGTTTMLNPSGSPERVSDLQEAALALGSMVAD